MNKTENTAANKARFFALTAAILLVIVMSGCHVKRQLISEPIPKGTRAIFTQMRVDSLGLLWMYNGVKYRLITLQ